MRLPIYFYCFYVFIFWLVPTYARQEISQTIFKKGRPFHQHISTHSQGEIPLQVTPELSTLSVSGKNRDLFEAFGDLTGRGSLPADTGEFDRVGRALNSVGPVGGALNLNANPSEGGLNTNRSHSPSNNTKAGNGSTKRPNFEGVPFRITPQDKIPKGVKKETHLGLPKDFDVNKYGSVVRGLYYKTLEMLGENPREVTDAQARLAMEKVDFTVYVSVDGGAPEAKHLLESEDPDTIAHEWTHMVNNMWSNATQKEAFFNPEKITYSEGKPDLNSLENSMSVYKDPGVSFSEITAAIPESLRGLHKSLTNRFKTYIDPQTRNPGMPQQGAYTMDEFNAYSLGLTSLNEISKAGDPHGLLPPNVKTDAASGAVEFAVYSLATAKAVADKLGTEYFQTAEGKAMRNHIAERLGYSFAQVQLSEKNPKVTHKDEASYFSAIQGEEKTEFGKFVVEFLGEKESGIFFNRFGTTL